MEKQNTTQNHGINKEQKSQRAMCDMLPDFFCFGTNIQLESFAEDIWV
jgi:hypothetical protein